VEVTTWGELTGRWINREVIVRWEDGSDSLADGLPSGVPHEWRGYPRWDGTRFFLSTHALEQGPPDHALVQEVS
jgi:hypothetical protein